MSEKHRPDRKDEARLLLWGIACAAGGLAYWHFLGARWGVAGFALLIASLLLWPASLRRRRK